MKIIAFLFTAFISLQMSGQEKFPDGTPIPDWFRQNEIVNIDTLGKEVYHYRLRCGKRQHNPANGENTGRHRPGSREWRRRYLIIPKANIPQRLHLLQAENASIHGRRCSAERK